MSQSIAQQKFSLDQYCSRSNAGESGLGYPRPLSRLQGRGRDYRGAVSIIPTLLPATRRVPPPDVRNIEVETPRRGLLSNVLALLRGGASAAKQLRLAETVALGEKRFVAIIHAEGQKYLVGGGASGVVLLTRLDDSTKPAESFQPFREAIEAAV